MRNRVLLIDAGNTSTKLGLGEGGRIGAVTVIPTRPRSVAAVVDTLRCVLPDPIACDCVISSVVPALNRTWRLAIRQLTGNNPVFVSHKLNLGIKVVYPKPETIGADRLANASAVCHRYGAPAIVADFGTALTFDVISEDAEYIGGVIVPGLPFMTDYLAEKTALLPGMELKGPCGHIGKSTKGAMRIGARIGYRGMVREIVNHIKSGLRHTRRVNLCATGGHARWALQGLNMPITIDRNLTLHGLYRIHELNSDR